LTEMLMPQKDFEFVSGEFEQLFLGDEELKSLCCRHARFFLPDGPAAVSVICDQIVVSLRDKIPMSILRVGNGEGNAVGMTKGVLHPLQISTFYTEFLSQNGISVPQEDAIGLCLEVYAALASADVIGFRSFRFDERSMILKSIEDGDAYAALGFLYARELLQQGLMEGYWCRGIITSAWIHLDLIPHFVRIFEAAKSIIVISGRSELRDEMKSRLSERLETFITVPVQGFLPPSAGQSHFYNAFPIVLKQLNRDLRGKLVLVGAGLFGKVYCHAAKLSGAVAIDLGSAFDLLAGLKTRPIHEHYDIKAIRWIN
jgi:hypothetical protein